MPPTLALATCADYRGLLDDDRPFVAALEARGVAVRPVVWDGPEGLAGLDGVAGVLLRSVWDYYRKAPAFRAWLDGLERAGLRCWNPPALVRWNLDKRYLLELGRAGVALPPTLWLEPGLAPEEAARRIEVTGWDDLVLKPAVSAGAWNTLRVPRGGLAGARPALAGLLALGTVLVQPFLPEVVADGELSFVFFGGVYSHAALKRARPGDFRVQWTHGGSHVPAAPAPALVEQARAALRAAPEPGLYARVDGIVRDGRLLLMELEQIEPYLFFAQGPGSAERFARLLAQALGAA